MTFFEDVPFDDTDFAALQWLGARGLNVGYRAEKETPLTQRGGAERLGRILRYHGRVWRPPALADPDAPLAAADLHAWLGRRIGIDSTGALRVGEFARIVYRHLTGT
ncbi:MAG: hypothetical protein SFV54_18690 [Bryobacteraceae bacterium]|nr:hypothetical protein [Bryobacteraceae bacterium]